MTIGDLTATLRRYWLVSLLVFCMVAGAGIAATQLAPDRYRSTATLSVIPVDESSFDFGGTQIIQYMVPPVLTRVQSEVFRNEIRRSLPADVAGSPVTLTVDNEPGTGIIEIGAISATPRAALAAARIADQRLRQAPGSRFIEITSLTPPSPAKSVQSERTPPIIAGSIVLALILAALAAVGAHQMRPPIPRSEKFRERYGYEVLGEIPRAKKLPTTAAAVFDDGSPAEVSAAFRNLEARVTMRLGGLDGASSRALVAVTSWGAGEGKTTVATNLAWAMASLEFVVTIADFDLRRPRVHEVLEVPSERGVADIAAGEETTSLGHASAQQDLWVIPGGVSDSHPAEAVHLAVAQLDEMRAQVVLLDTPPMFTPETIEIIGAVDAVLLVVDARARTARDVEEALAELALTGTRVLGVVINRSKVRDGRGRMGYYYDDAPNGASRGRASLRSRVRHGRDTTAAAKR